MPSTEKGIVVRITGRDTRNEAVQRYITEEAWLIDEVSAAVQEADASDVVFVPHAEVMAGLDAEIKQARPHHSL